MLFAKAVGPMSNVDWPPGFDRTPPQDRSQNNRYQTSLSKAFDDLERELDRLGVGDFRYSFDADQRKTDQRPYARANPDHPGFVLRWTMNEAQYAVACDRYSKLRDNVRTVGLYLQEKRKMEQRPVATGESEFANARLPPGDPDSEAVIVGPEPDPHEVLGFAPNADPEVVNAAAKQLLKKNHPDQGGDVNQFKRVQLARKKLVDSAVQ